MYSCGCALCIHFPLGSSSYPSLYMKTCLKVTRCSVCPLKCVEVSIAPQLNCILSRHQATRYTVCPLRPQVCRRSAKQTTDTVCWLLWHHLYIHANTIVRNCILGCQGCTCTFMEIVWVDKGGIPRETSLLENYYVRLQVSKQTEDNTKLKIILNIAIPM